MNDPQKKCRLGTVGKNILLEDLIQFHGITDQYCFVKNDFQTFIHFTLIKRLSKRI